MSTTLAKFKTLVKSKLKFLNLSWVDLASIGDGTDFDSYCQLYLTQWAREAEEIFAFKSALTTTLAAQTYTLTTQRMHTVKDVYITNVKIQRLPFGLLQDRYNVISASNGTPVAWSQLDNYRIIFDKPTTAAIATCYVNGWVDPATITADTSTIEIPDSHIEAAATYVAVQFAEPAVNDAAGAARLQRYIEKAMAGLAAVRAENRSNFFGTTVPGG